MLLRSLLAFLLLIAWPFAGHPPAHSASHGQAPAAAAPVVVVWIDSQALPAAADAAAEARVFEQTLIRTIELFLPVGESSRAGISRAAAAFAERKPLLLQVSRVDAGVASIEFVESAGQPANAAAAIPHREWAASLRGADAGKPVFELFIDVDALRREFLDSFADGRGGRVIHALGVPNARSLMLHGRWIAPEKVAVFDPALPIPPASRRPGEYARLGGPPIVRMDLSWNSRADEPTIIRGQNIAAGHWPASQLKMQPPAAPFLCLFRANFRAWLASALAIRSAWIDPAESLAFGQTCATWLRANRPSIDRIAGAVPSWLVVHPGGRFPDWFVAESPLRADNTSPDPIVREIDQLIRKQFADQIERIPDGGSRFPAPTDWPLSVIGWNPNPRPPLATMQIYLHLRGGKLDAAK